MASCIFWFQSTAAARLSCALVTAASAAVFAASLASAGRSATADCAFANASRWSFTDCCASLRVAGVSAAAIACALSDVVMMLST